MSERIVREIVMSSGQINEMTPDQKRETAKKWADSVGGMSLIRTLYIDKDAEPNDRFRSEVESVDEPKD